MHKFVNPGSHAAAASSLRRRDVLGAGAVWSALAPWPGQAVAQTPKRMEDLLVVVPGIMGSTLLRDGKVVWGLSGSAVIEVLKAGNLDLAHLRADAAGPALQVGGVFESATVIPGFWKLDGYTELRAGLGQALALTAGENYREFAYDWRQDNRISARQLVQQLQAWLAHWRALSGNPNARAVLVCHSMGGLVARYACEVLGGHALVRALFTLGTPYQGAFTALSRLVNGFVSPSLTRTLASFDSVHQLLPTYDCLVTAKGQRQTLAQALASLAPWLDTRRVAEVGLGFHEECAQAVARRRQAGQATVPLYLVQSSTHRTPALGSLVGDRLETVHRWEGHFTMGDGTVPGYSLAQPAQGAAPVSVNHCNQLHGAIQIYAPTLDHVVGTLQTGLPASLRSGEAVSLQCADVVKAGEDLGLRIAFSLQPGPDAEVRLQSVATGEVLATAELKPVFGQVDFAPSLSAPAAGLFRLVLMNRGQALCSDLVAVL